MMTAEELQKIWAEKMRSVSWDGQWSTVRAEENGCKHESAEYVGFTQRYAYCKKCDAKDYGAGWEGEPR
jgi:hypothetical protein